MSFLGLTEENHLNIIYHMLTVRMMAHTPCVYKANATWMNKFH